ncbi:hypothetical protein AC1031_012878 [Aphanomyces cochlioides]|nr:hypothetical protein AC1031_012878 [Aphanomyces cochlioides]
MDAWHQRIFNATVDGILGLSVENAKTFIYEDRMNTRPSIVVRATSKDLVDAFTIHQSSVKMGSILNVTFLPRSGVSGSYLLDVPFSTSPSMATTTRWSLPTRSRPRGRSVFSNGGNGNVIAHTPFVEANHLLLQSRGNGIIQFGAGIVIAHDMELVSMNNGSVALQETITNVNRVSATTAGWGNLYVGSSLPGSLVTATEIEARVYCMGDVVFSAPGSCNSSLTHSMGQGNTFAHRVACRDTAALIVGGGNIFSTSIETLTTEVNGDGVVFASLEPTTSINGTYLPMPEFVFAPTFVSFPMPDHVPRAVETTTVVQDAQVASVPQVLLLLISVGMLVAAVLVVLAHRFMEKRHRLAAPSELKFVPMATPKEACTAISFRSVTRSVELGRSFRAFGKSRMNTQVFNATSLEAINGIVLVNTGAVIHSAPDATTHSVVLSATNDDLFKALSVTVIPTDLGDTLQLEFTSQANEIQSDYTIDIYVPASSLQFITVGNGDSTVVSPDTIVSDVSKDILITSTGTGSILVEAGAIEANNLMVLAQSSGAIQIKLDSLAANIVDLATMADGSIALLAGSITANSLASAANAGDVFVGSGSTDASAITATNVVAKVFSSGNVVFASAGTCDKSLIEVNGDGHVFLNTIQANDTSAVILGAGNIYVSAVISLNVEDNGVGTLYASTAVEATTSGPFVLLPDNLEAPTYTELVAPEQSLQSIDLPALPSAEPLGLPTEEPTEEPTEAPVVDTTIMPIVDGTILSKSLDGGNKGLSGGAFAGIGVGVGAFFVLLALLVVALRRRRRLAKGKSFEVEFASLSTPTVTDLDELNLETPVATKAVNIE